MDIIYKLMKNKIIYREKGWHILVHWCIDFSMLLHFNNYNLGPVVQPCGLVNSYACIHVGIYVCIYIQFYIHVKSIGFLRIIMKFSAKKYTKTQTELIHTDFLYHLICFKDCINMRKSFLVKRKNAGN